MKPCRYCGDTKVIRTVTIAMDPKLELVIVECLHCERRRSTYYRKKRSKESSA